MERKNENRERSAHILIEDHVSRTVSAGENELAVTVQ